MSDELEFAALEARARTALQRRLLEAYKQAERLPGSGLVLFRLSSIPIDRATPNEALRANVAWVRGLDEPIMLLSDRQLASFRRDKPVASEQSIRGVPSSLLAVADLSLAARSSRHWLFGLDGAFDARQVVDLARDLGAEGQVAAELQSAIDRDLRLDRQQLHDHLAAADGLQVTGAPTEDARHLANTLFNVMRGGTFLDDMLARLGFDNVGRSLTGRYPEIVPANLGDRPPRVVLAASEPFPFTQQHLPELDADFAGSRAVLVDGELFSWHGVRLLQAAEYFRQLVATLRA